MEYKPTDEHFIYSFTEKHVQNLLKNIDYNIFAEFTTLTELMARRHIIWSVCWNECGLAISYTWMERHQEAMHNLSSFLGGRAEYERTFLKNCRIQFLNKWKSNFYSLSACGRDILTHWYKTCASLKEYFQEKRMSNLSPKNNFSLSYLITV